MQNTNDSLSPGWVWYEPSRVNLHTHSAYCNHGGGSLRDHLVQGRAQGLAVIGFSEHAPVPNNRWGRSRMALTDLSAYFKELDAIGGEQSPIVLRAMECDYHDLFRNYYRKDIAERYRCDYLIGSVHFVDMPYQRDIPIHKAPVSVPVLKEYARQYIAMMESGLFLFGAHPDVFGCSYPDWDAEAQACSRDILSAAESLDMPLEINANGFKRAPVMTASGPARPYPLRRFWELAGGYGIRVVVNSDAHYPEHATANYDDCFAFARNVGLDVCALCVGPPDSTGKRPLVHVPGRY